MVAELGLLVASLVGVLIVVVILLVADSWLVADWSTGPKLVVGIVVAPGADGAVGSIAGGAPVIGSIAGCAPVNVDGGDGDDDDVVGAVVSIPCWALVVVVNDDDDGFADSWGCWLVVSFSSKFR